MRKVISYSLWGKSKLYCQGAIENVKLSAEHYPGWINRFYIAADCPATNHLRGLPNVELQIMPPMEGVDRTQENHVWHNNPSNNAMMWRFSAIDDCSADYVIFRDTDSRLNPRGAAAVEEWIKSGKYAHRMHECKEHWNALMMGGMWGIKGGKLIRNHTIKECYEAYVDPTNLFGFYRLGEPTIFVDLYFIKDTIWPMVKNDCMGHGYGHPLNFPPVRYDGKVGDVANEEWRKEDFK
jgi:hypothetical protein